MTIIGAVLALTLLLAACGSNDDNKTTSGATATTAAAASSSGDKSSGGYYGGGATSDTSSATSVKLADTKLGKILTDGEGHTVYIFDLDKPGQASACTGQCASNWPAVTGKASAGSGVEDGDLGTATTANGTQVTYYGHRLYRFAADTAAGDTKGQGVAGKWHVVNAEGDPVM